MPVSGRLELRLESKKMRGIYVPRIFLETYQTALSAAPLCENP
jgi:hypothetical protein